MFLYHLTLQQATTIQQMVSGSFVGPPASSASKAGAVGQEVAIVRGTSILELIKVDPGTGQMKAIGRAVDTFSTIRSISTLRLPGDDKDLLVVGNDSGRLMVYQWSAKGEAFELLRQETFGRSGCRRSIPGQYVAADPRGRAIMVGAVDRQKLVYLVNHRDSGNEGGAASGGSSVILSSPLEAHVPGTICLAMAALDGGWEGNPMFACLEAEYSDVDDLILQGKWDEARASESTGIRLTFYEVDLGLGHVTRKRSVPVGESAHHLIAVPGGSDGPGGVLVCESSRILWIGPSEEQQQSVPIPRADDSDNAFGIVNCSAIVRAKGKLFFHLLQFGGHGDLFKVTLKVDGDGQVQGLALRYFDTCSVASSMAVLKSGFLLLAGESANHTAYQIQSLGEHPDEPEFANESSSDDIVFIRRGLRNLAPTSEMDNFAPMTAAALLNPGDQEEAPQLFACQGSGPSSTLNILRHGLGVTELAHSELPATPTGLWTLRQNLADPFDAFLVISFPEATTVLSIGEAIEEVPDSGFLLETPSLAAFQVATGAMVQVHPQGVRQVSPSAGIVEWKAAPGTTVKCAAHNTRQLVLFLSPAQVLVYFELDQTSGLLTERKTSPSLPESVTAMHIGAVPFQRQRNRWLAIGSDAGLVRIVSLDPGDCLEPVSLQALAANPSSLMLLAEGSRLEVGLVNGVLVSLTLDPLSGALGDPKTRFIGPSPVRLAKGPKDDHEEQLLVLSSRTWLRHNWKHCQVMTPLFYEPLECATGFASEATPTAIVASIGSTLRIISMDTTAAATSLFTRHRTVLPATPKRLSFNPSMNLFAVQGALFDPFQGQLLASINLAADEQITAQAFVTFHERPAERMLAVGIAKNLTLAPRAAEAAFIDLYLIKSSSSLELIHRTPLDEAMIPSVMTAFAGRLLAGVGPALRLYDLGRARLLKKCETRLPTFATCLQTQGFRLAVGDAHQGLQMVQYLPDDNQFLTFADESCPRALSCLAFLDYETVAGGDRFGNLFVARLPPGLGEAVEIDGTVVSPVNKQAGLLGAPHKLERLVEFHLNDTPIALHKAALSSGARQVIHYATVSGAIGVLLPLTSRSEALLLQNLELAMRSEAPALLGGRDHLAYRSAYYPLKGVIDGGLCESFLGLPEDRQAQLTQLLDVPSVTILQRKIQALRSSIGF